MAYTKPGRTRDKVFRFVRERLLAGSPPTVREVQEAMGFKAVESARRQLDGLVDDGRLAKTPGLSRSYRLAERGGRTRPPQLVPLLGRVQAGGLHAAIEDPDGWIALDGEVRGDEFFALRVRGDSMTGAGILDGDVVVVRRQEKAESGDVIVALVGEEATVKTLRRRGRRVELVPQNPAYPVLAPEPGELEILGKVVEVRRRLG
jgi:repressor LexA